MLLFCEHRQSFAGLFLTLQNGASLSLRPNLFFLLPKMFIMTTFLVSCYPLFSLCCGVLKTFDSTHISYQETLFWFKLLLQIFSYFSHIPFYVFSVLHKTQVLYIKVSVNIFLLRIWARQIPFICEAISPCCEYKMFFVVVVLFSVNQIAYDDNIHAIWSSVHNVCIR